MGKTIGRLWELAFARVTRHFSPGKAEEEGIFVSDMPTDEEQSQTKKGQ